MSKKIYPFKANNFSNLSHVYDFLNSEFFGKTLHIYFIIDLRITESQ